MSNKAAFQEAKPAVLELVRATAKSHSVVTYPQVAQPHPVLPKTGVAMGRAVGALLGEINEDEGILISAVVVQKGTLLPGPGFFGLPGAPRTLDRYNSLLRRVWKKYGP